MIILFIFYLFVHLNLIRCNEIKNWTTNAENKIVVTQRYIRNGSHAIYQPTSNRRGKRANTPPRRSQSRSPTGTSRPYGRQRTPPQQLQPGNPFGVQQFPPALPIAAGQPFMPQPIAVGQPPPAPIGPVGQMLPPIGGRQPNGQMPMNIMPAAFGQPQQPQYMQPPQQPSLQPQNIPQHRSPIAPRPASPIYELQSLYEQPQVHSPQHYHNLSPTQRAIFEDIQQDVQIRNIYWIPEGQHIRISQEQQAQFDELYQATNVGYRRAVQRHLNALRRGDTTRQYDENLIAGFRGLHVYGRVPLNHFTTYGFQTDNLKREFIARGIPLHPTYRGRPSPPQNNEFNMAMALSDLEAHLWRRHSVGSPAPPENIQQQAPMAIPHQQRHAGFIDPVFLRQQIPPRGNIADAIHPSPNVPQRRSRSRSPSPHSPGNRAIGPPPKRGRSRSPPKGFGGRKKRNAKFA